MKRLAVLAMLLALPGCPPVHYTPAVPDAQTDGGCATYDKITTERVIANPDGTPLIIHCDGGP